MCVTQEMLLSSGEDVASSSITAVIKRAERGDFMKRLALNVVNLYKDMCGNIADFIREHDNLCSNIAIIATCVLAVISFMVKEYCNDFVRTVVGFVFLAVIWLYVWIIHICCRY